MAMELYRVAFRVQPTPEHPTYWDWETGVLFFWVFAPGMDEAIERATLVIKAMPLETIGGKISVGLSNEQGTEDFISAEKAAKHVGLGLLLHALRTGCGTSESDFAELFT